MQFYEKLIFVMNLTQTTNRELALAAQVDPSIISRFRSGKRGIPRNLEPLRSMADFLAERCTGEYQRRALSEMAGVRRVLMDKQDQLSEFLFCWLCGDADGVERFMRSFESLTIKGLRPTPPWRAQQSAVKGILFILEMRGSVPRCVPCTNTCWPVRNRARSASLPMKPTIG